MNGNLAGAFARLDASEAHSETTLERVAGRQLRIGVLTSMNRLLEAVDCGVETARMLGAVMPENDADLGAAIGAELGGLKQSLASRSIESLLDLPEMQDPERRALAAVLFKTNSSAFMAKPQMSVLIGLKAVRLAIEHGNAPTSPYFYANYGIINYAVGGELDVSYRFGAPRHRPRRPGRRVRRDRRVDLLPVRRVQLPLAATAVGEHRAPRPRGERLSRDGRLCPPLLGGRDSDVLPLLPG